MADIEQKFYIIDETGIKWWMPDFHTLRAQAYCIKDHLALRKPPYNASFFICDECGQKTVPRSLLHQEEYAANKIRSQTIAKFEVVNFDGQLFPISKKKTKDDNFSVSTQIMNSKHGKQIVIYAGQKGHKNTQIFVDTENHKLSFDHKDMKPTEIFAKIEATFKDGSKMAIEAEPEA